MSDPSTAVVLCADDHYRVPLGVAVSTVAAHHTSSVLDLVIFGDGIGEDFRFEVERHAGPHRVQWLEPDLDALANTKLPPHLSKAALFRLQAPQVLGDRERILYLDVDLVVTDDLGDLLATDLHGAAVGAVRDAWIGVAGAPNGPPLARLGLSAHDAYFNSGVLLIDREAWQRQSITERSLEALEQGTLPYGDQCALNSALAGRWSELHPRWNVQTATGSAADHDTDPRRQVAVNEALDAPAVIHYTGRKPWDWPDVVRSESWFAALRTTSFTIEEEATDAGPASVSTESWRDVARRRIRPTAAKAAKRVVMPLARAGGIEVRAAGAPTRPAKVSAAVVDLVVRRTEMVVSAGPFRGMVLPERATWGGSADLVPKLLGVYEQELEGVVEELVASSPDRVVNLGCADGYYSIGMARRLASAEVIGVDLVEESLGAARLAAADNGVADRCTFLDHMDLVPEVSSAIRSVWLVDIEGAEHHLTDERWVARMRNDHLLVECHDFARPGVTADLCVAYASTHDVEVISQGGRDPNAIPLLRNVDESERWLAMSEGRPRPMHWLVLRPRREPLVT